MTEVPSSAQDPAAGEPQFRYVEELVRHRLSASLGGPRGMLEGALPFVAFTVCWVATHQMVASITAALGLATVLAVVRLIQRQPLKFVAQALLPILIAALIASRTHRAEDIFLPGIVYNGVLALISGLTIVVGWPLVGFLIGGATGDPTGWAKDRGLVRLASKLTAVLAVPYVLRFAVQLPLFYSGQVVWLGVAKVVLGWPLLIATLFGIGLMLSKGRTPIADPAPTGAPAQP